MTSGKDNAGRATGEALAERLEKLQKLEEEIIRKCAALVKPGASITHADLFVTGAVRRVLAQARGFRDLITAKNFPCAAAILRMQLDTAMRVNALFLVEDMNACCEAVLINDVRFNTLKDADGKRLSDAYLRAKLSDKHPWVNEVYKQTSDFVHLSGRHFWSSIVDADDETRIVNFFISGHDPTRPEEVYFEIVDVFFEATKLVAIMILAYFGLRSGAITLKDPTAKNGEPSSRNPSTFPGASFPSRDGS
jgi:hypothetical protein